MGANMDIGGGVRQNDMGVGVWGLDVRISGGGLAGVPSAADGGAGRWGYPLRRSGLHGWRTRLPRTIIRNNLIANDY